MEKYLQHLKNTQTILKKSLKHKKPYTVSILDKNFIVLPKVFSPKYFFDTEIFAKKLPIEKNSSLLEIGPGTGIISVIACFKGAKKVVAIDINPQAVKNTSLNIQKHKLSKKFEVRHGDLFKPLNKQETFDVIFWNVPFGLVNKKALSTLEKAVFDYQYIKIKEYVQNASSHLKPQGKIFIGFSSTLGKLNTLKNIAKKSKYKLKLISETKSTEIYSVKFEIYKLIKN